MPKQLQYGLAAIALLIIGYAIFDSYTSITQAGSQTRESINQIDQGLRKAQQSP